MTTVRLHQMFVNKPPIGGQMRDVRRKTRMATAAAAAAAAAMLLAACGGGGAQAGGSDDGASKVFVALSYSGNA